MENLTTSNGMNIEGFRAMCIAHHNSLSKKTIQYTDFISFILENGIHEELEMIFMTASNYYIGEFEGSHFGAGEDVWDCLESLVKKDMDTIEREFQNVEFLDDERTAIANIGNKEYAILVA